jgi:hypothetical protein
MDKQNKRLTLLSQLELALIGRIKLAALLALENISKL